MPIVRTLLAVPLLLCSVSSPAFACYAVIVGKQASADGSVLVGHNEENGGRRVLYFHKIPRQQHPPGSVVRLKRGGQLEEAPESLAFLWSENPGLEFSDSYLNEHGVAVVSDACPTRENSYETLVARGEIRDGGIGYMLRRLVALRAKTAREGVDLIGRLVERFGYVDSGRTYVVADPSEAWVVAVVRGRRWVAQRVPDDQVVILANVHIIGEVNLADAEHFRASADLVSYAAGRGWFTSGGNGPPFSFRAVYQAKERLAPDPRQARGQALVTGKADTWPPEGPLPFSVTPRKKLAVADVVAVLRDQAGRVPLFQKTTQEAAVFQLRADMPRDLGCIYWRISSRPDVAPLTPWYLGITETPESYHRPDDVDKRLSLDRHFNPPPGTFDLDLRLAWWKFKRLEELVDEDGKTRSPAVRNAWSALESRIFARQQSIESEAWRRWQASPDAARTYLTQHCADLAEEAGREADRFSSGFQATQKGNSNVSRKLNVLFIMTDEQHYRSLSVTGNPYVSTPNMDRIAREGARFDNATCVTPFCSPSRASIITGLYPHTHGILLNVDGKGATQPPLKPDAFPSTETLLHRAGYALAHRGKWHLGDPGDFPGYESRTYLGRTNPEYGRLLNERLPTSRFASHPSPGKYLGRPVEMIPAIEKAYHAFHAEPNNRVAYISIIGRSLIPPELLPETRMTDDVLRLLEEHAHEPFMITVSWSPPHDLWVIPEPYYSMVDRSKIRLPGGRTLPEWDARGPSKRLGDLAGEEGLREYAAIYHGMVKYIDDQLGRILRKLDELKLSDRTLVIFTTDHGDMVGAHGCIGKSIASYYDDLVRIPLLIRLPGAIKPGTVVSQPVSQIDLMPTILDYVGRPVPERLHGRSLRPLLDGRDVPWRDYAFCQRANQSRMLRTDRYKYVYGKQRPKQPPMVALYDLRQDPDENQNLAASPKHADLVRLMHRRLLEVMAQDGDPLRASFPRDPLSKGDTP